MDVLIFFRYFSFQITGLHMACWMVMKYNALCYLFGTPKHIIFQNWKLFENVLCFVLGKQRAKDSSYNGCYLFLQFPCIKTICQYHSFLQDEKNKQFTWSAILLQVYRLIIHILLFCNAIKITSCEDSFQDLNECSQVHITYCTVIHVIIIRMITFMVVKF